jgi:L-fucose isomerase-like protein
VLFLPVIRGNYDRTLTLRVKQAARRACAALGIDAVFPADNLYTEGLIYGDDDVRDYAAAWAPQMADVKALCVVSGDFMRERAVQDTVRLLPQDVPLLMIVNNDDPTDMSHGKVGDSLCGTLSVHHNMRMLGRRLLRSCRIDIADEACLCEQLAEAMRQVDGIETLRNMRVAMIGVNPDPFATTFANQLKLFELGFSLHTYELLEMWGDVMLGRNTDEGDCCVGPFGQVRFRNPIRRGDERLPEVKEQLRALVPNLPGEEKLDTIARCFLWVKDVYERDFIDTGGIHCWGEHARHFGMAPCSYAMLANALLKRPLVCEVDVCHAIMARLAWTLTGEAGVILDINNNGWDPRVFNVFHCSQTAPNWLAGDANIGDYGSIEGAMAPVPFTGISAATSSDAFRAVVFHGHFLRRQPHRRGSSGWAFVPNLPEVLEAVQEFGIHHFVALKGHAARGVSDVLRFRGIEVDDLAEPLADIDTIESELPAPRAPDATGRRVFSD